MNEQIKLLAIEGNGYYYSIKIPKMKRDVMFRVWCFRETYTLEEVYKSFNKAMEELFMFEKLRGFTLKPFYMVTLNVLANQIEFNNFELFEYERFYKGNENACVYLKSVSVDIDGDGFHYYFESFDEESDLENEEVLDYCQDYANRHIEEFEQLFYAPYLSTEYYI